MNHQLSFRAAFLDVDGTLVDTVPLHERAMMNALSEHGYSGVQESPHMVHRSMSERLARFCSDEATARAIYARKKELYAKYLQTDIEPQRALSRLLERVSRQRVLLAVSNSTTARATLDRAGLLAHFAHVLVPRGDDRPKPAPDLYARALSAGKLSTSEVVVVEDSLDGMRAALSAGIPYYRIVMTSHTNIMGVLKSWL